MQTNGKNSSYHKSSQTVSTRSACEIWSMKRATCSFWLGWVWDWFLIVPTTISIFGSWFDAHVWLWPIHEKLYIVVYNAIQYSAIFFNLVAAFRYYWAKTVGRKLSPLLTLVFISITGYHLMCVWFLLKTLQITRPDLAVTVCCCCRCCRFNSNNTGMPSDSIKSSPSPPHTSIYATAPH